ncbi:RHS repeat-associated core domain-containing protein [Pseudomonas cerasi]
MLTGPRDRNKPRLHVSLTCIYRDVQSYEPLARVDGTENPEIYWFHNAANGMPERLTDGKGRIRWEGISTPWGKLLSESNQRVPGYDQNLRLQGLYLDRQTGLHYNLFRYYDPDSARFTQHDPIGLAGGLNLYQYAPNPLNWIDPLGLTKCMGVSESGHHVPYVRKSKGRPFAVTRSDKTRPTFFPRGTQPEHDHWRIHDAERAYVGPCQGDFPGSDRELFDAY